MMFNKTEKKELLRLLAQCWADCSVKDQGWSANVNALLHYAKPSKRASAIRKIRSRKQLYRSMIFKLTGQEPPEAVRGFFVRPYKRPKGFGKPGKKYEQFVGHYARQERKRIADIIVGFELGDG